MQAPVTSFGIIACVLLPLLWALCFQGESMFYFNLYDDPALEGCSISEKNKIINIAVKQARIDNPLNISKRLAILGGVVFLPAFVLYYLFGFNAAFSWALVSIMLLNIKLASLETPTIKPYLTKALTLVKKKT